MHEGAILKKNPVMFSFVRSVFSSYVVKPLPGRHFQWEIYYSHMYVWPWIQILHFQALKERSLGASFVSPKQIKGFIIMTMDLIYGS